MKRRERRKTGWNVPTAQIPAEVPTRHVHHRNVVGKLINFRGLVYAPVNENGVIFLFGKVAADLNMYVETIRPGYRRNLGALYVGTQGS